MGDKGEIIAVGALPSLMPKSLGLVQHTKRGVNTSPIVLSNLQAVGSASLTTKLALNGVVGIKVSLLYNIGMETKLCPKCKIVKPVSEFRKNKTRYDGLDSYCKPCRQDYTKQDRNKDSQRYRDYYNKWRKENVETAKQNYQEWYKANKQRKLDYNKKHNKENKEHNNQLAVKRRYKNIEANRAYRRFLYYKNPQATIQINHRRRAQKRNSEGSYTQIQWKALCELHDNRCLCCGEQKPLTVDHVIPLSKGGTNNIDNIQPLCKSCNSKKWQQSTDYRP